MRVEISARRINVVVTTCIKAVHFVLLFKFILIESRFLPNLPLIGLGFLVAARRWFLEALAGAMSQNTTIATFACEFVLSAWVLTGATTLFALTLSRT